MSQRDREGRLALKYRLPPNLATHPSDCKAGAPKKPSPLGEGGRREPDGRGELAIYLDCFTANAPTPKSSLSNQDSAQPRNTAQVFPKRNWGKVAPVMVTDRGFDTILPPLASNSSTPPKPFHPTRPTPSPSRRRPHARPRLSI